MFKSIGGASWGGAVLSLYPAYKFAQADAESHTISSKQIERAHESQQSTSAIAVDESKEPSADPENTVTLSIAGDSDQDPPIVLKLTAQQWKISIYHFLNDILKTSSDCMMILNILESILENCKVISPASEDDWIRPTIHLFLNCGFFALGAYANAQELRNTTTSYMGENREATRKQSAQ